MRFYGLDLRYQLKASARRIWALLKGLPPDAATWREETAWTQAHELAATQIEVSDAWGRAIFTALGGKPRGKPIHIKRPSGPEEPGEELISDGAKLRRWFNQNVS